MVKKKKNTYVVILLTGAFVARSSPPRSASTCVVIFISFRSTAALVRANGQVPGERRETRCVKLLPPRV